MRKVYLGDGVYCEADPSLGAIVLTTENGIEVTNRIVLEEEVYQNLIDYYQSITGER